MSFMPIDEARQTVQEFERDLQRATPILAEMNQLLQQSLGLLGRMGLPEEIEAQIRQVQRLITVLNQLRLTLIAIQAASGPYGWAIAALGAGATVMSTGQMLAWESRGR